MVIDSNFKQTDIGIFPNDWEVISIGNLTSSTAGGTPSTKTPNFWGGNIPWMNSGELNNKRIYDVIGRITESGLKNSSTKYIPEKCILIGLAGQGKTRGTVAINYIKLCTNQSIAAIFPNQKYIPEYLYYYLDAKYQELRDLSSGDGGRGGLNLKLINSIKIPLPPLAEQHAIAEALSDVDALIASLVALIAKKRAIKEGVMQELLTRKRRLPGFSGEWKIINLEDVANKNIKWSFTGGPFGSNLKSSEYSSTGVRIIQLQNIGDGVFHNDYAIYTTEEKADELISCNIFPGEIILSKMGDPVARACLVPGFDKRYLMASDGIRLAVDEKSFDKYFILFSINSPEFRKNAIEASTGTTRQRIGLDKLRNLKMLLPEKKEQSAIAEIINDLDHEIIALDQKRDKTKALRQGMMQELLTGRIRL